MQKTKQAWLGAAVALCGVHPIYAGNDVSDPLLAYTASSASLVLPVSNRKPTDTFGLGIQYRNGCDYLYARECAGDRKRVEIKSPGTSNGFSLLSYETFAETARDTILSKSVTTPFGDAKANAAWREHVDGWMAGFDHLFLFKDDATIKLGISAGHIAASGGIGGMASANLNGGTYDFPNVSFPAQNISFPASLNVSPKSAGSETFNIEGFTLSAFGRGFTVPAISVTIPRVTLPGLSVRAPAITLSQETFTWASSAISLHGRNLLSVAQGSVTLPSVTVANGVVHTPSFTTPQLQITVPSLMKDVDKYVSGEKQSYFGELRLAAGFDRALGMGNSTGSHVRISLNPFAIVDTKAVYGIGAGIEIGTRSLTGTAANAEGYRNQALVPGAGHAFSVSLYEQRTAFDFPYYEVKRESQHLTKEINNYLAAETAKANAELLKVNSEIAKAHNELARANTDIATLPVALLTAPSITSTQLLQTLGIQSPLGSETSLKIGFGGNLPKRFTYSLGASLPLRGSLGEKLYNASVRYNF